MHSEMSPITRALIIEGKRFIAEGHRNLATARELLSHADKLLSSMRDVQTSGLRSLDIATQLLQPESERRAP